MDGGSLQDIVDTGGCSNEQVLASISCQILGGLVALHSQQQIHRDVKPASLLINHKGRVKISSFGTARSLEDSMSRAATFVGCVSKL
jgi:serine/threonine protein kinase